MNMSDVIIPKSDQINADDLIGRDMTITIRDVQIRGGQEQPVSIFFEGSDKAFRPCKSMSRVLVNGWGADAKQYIGRSLTLYRDPTVKWGGLDVGGIRISHMSHIERPMTMALTATKGSRKPYTVKPLVALARDERPSPQVDRVGDGVRVLIARIEATEPADMRVVVNDPAVITQRTWLATNRPELARQVDEAIAAVVDAPGDDPFGANDEGPADSDRGDGFDGGPESERITDELIAGLTETGKE